MRSGNWCHFTVFDEDIKVVIYCRTSSMEIAQTVTANCHVDRLNYLTLELFSGAGAPHQRGIVWFLISQ